MKIEFWAFITAMLIVGVVVFLVWWIFGKPTLSPGESFVSVLAITALLDTTRQDLLKK